MPSHQHTSRIYYQYNGSNITIPTYKLYLELQKTTSPLVYTWGSNNVIGETSSVGGSQPHTHTFTGTATTINTMPPYITVYMYKRTA